MVYLYYENHVMYLIYDFKNIIHFFVSASSVLYVWSKNVYTHGDRVVIDTCSGDARYRVEKNERKVYRIYTAYVENTFRSVFLFCLCPLLKKRDMCVRVCVYVCDEFTHNMGKPTGPAYMM